MRSKIGGGLLIAASVAAPVIVDKMDIQLSADQGIALLSVCAVVAFIGLVLVLWPDAKVGIKPEEPRRPSTSIKVRGKGRLDLEDFVSTADIFADVDNFENISVRRGVHLPNERDLPKGRARGGSHESDVDDTRNDSR